MYINLSTPIQVQMFGFVRQKHGRWRSARAIDSHLLLYVTEGLLDMQIADCLYKAKPEDILLIPAGTSYQPMNPEGCAYYFFHFSARTSTVPSAGKIFVTDTSKLPEGQYAYTYTDESEPIIEIPNYISCAGALQIKEILNRAETCNIWREKTEKFLLDCLLKEFLLHISYLRKKNVTDKQLLKILAYIDENYTEELSLTKIAQHAKLSVSYVARLFKKNLKMRPSDYVNRVRLSAACKFLSNTDLPIGEIAELCGYQSPYYFTRIFKKTQGITPKAFRSSNIYLKP